MQHFKKHLAGLLLITIAVIGIMASTSSHKSESASNYLLPSDFNPNKQVLLIEITGNDDQVRQMKEYMSQNYPFKYAFVTWDDMNTDKYADENMYRFLLRKVVVSNGRTKTFDYCFYDHIHNQQYEKSGNEGISPEKPLEKIVRKIVKKYQ